MIKPRIYLFGFVAFLGFISGCGNNESSSDSSVVQNSVKKRETLSTTADDVNIIQVRTLWKQGADAKHRGDYEGARAAWRQILTLSPNRSGIQEAIDKLPRRKSSRVGRNERNTKNHESRSKRKDVYPMNITHEQIKKGDIVTNTTEIRRYDIVCFERTGESQVICRTLSSAEAATYQGNKYQIDRGNEPGSLQYIKVE